MHVIVILLGSTVWIRGSLTGPAKLSFRVLLKSVKSWDKQTRWQSIEEGGMRQKLKLYFLGNQFLNVLQEH